VKWMLDTDTCIAFIKKHPGALKKLRGKSIGQVGVSSITLGELAFGAHKSSRPKDARSALSEFLLALEIAAFDDHAAMRYGEVRPWLARRGDSGPAVQWVYAVDMFQTASQPGGTELLVSRFPNFGKLSRLANREHDEHFPSRRA